MFSCSLQCVAVTLSHWSQRSSCSTHTHCRACGVSSTSTAFCVSACVCVCMRSLQYRVKAAVSMPPLLPCSSLCKHSTSAAITGEPAEALSPLPTSELSLGSSDPTLSYMATHNCEHEQLHIHMENTHMCI